MTSKRILLVIGGNTRAFREVGGYGRDKPRLPAAYTFLGALSEAGFDVTLRGGLRLADFVGILREASSRDEYDGILFHGSVGAWCALIGAALSWDLSRFAFLSYTNRPGEGGRPGGRLKDALYGIGAPRADRVFFMTQEQAATAARGTWGRPIRAVAIPLGVDTQFFRPRAGDEESIVVPGARRGRRYVVVAGDQLRDEPRVEAILSGLGVDLVRLTMSREVEAYWQERQRSDGLGFSVSCRVLLPFVEVAAIYRHAACVLNPVLNTWQPAGWTVTTEGMASGVPVVTAAGLVTRELGTYLDRGQSLPLTVVEGLSVGAYRAALERVLSDDFDAVEAGAAARAFAEEHLAIDRTGRLAAAAMERWLADR
ncbi:MAG: hypothetical protein JRI55_22615 [Deltaproteobacteria bacterium]|jgi:glycosyltransferase involved in cell wall biosynthesis|nr:hypothetical protein [Deltaproteobacteria bacterium]